MRSTNETGQRWTRPVLSCGAGDRVGEREWYRSDSLVSKPPNVAFSATHPVDDQLSSQNARCRTRAGRQDSIRFTRIPPLCGDVILNASHDQLLVEPAIVA